MRHRKTTYEFDYNNCEINSDGGCYLTILQRGEELLKACLSMHEGRVLFGFFSLHIPRDLQMTDGSSITWFCNTWKKNRALAGFPVHYLWTAFGNNGRLAGYHLAYFTNCGFQGKPHHDYAAKETWCRIVRRSIDDEEIFSHEILGETARLWSDVGITIDEHRPLSDGPKAMVIGTISSMAQCSRMHGLPAGSRLFSSSQLPAVA